MRPQTIQIFLPNGNPRGLKIAELTNRLIKAIYFPRKLFNEAISRSELKNVGLYFLFEDSTWFLSLKIRNKSSAAAAVSSIDFLVTSMEGHPF